MINWNDAISYDISCYFPNCQDRRRKLVITAWRSVDILLHPEHPFSVIHPRSAAFSAAAFAFIWRVQKPHDNPRNYTQNKLNCHWMQSLIPPFYCVPCRAKQDVVCYYGNRGSPEPIHLKPGLCF